MQEFLFEYQKIHPMNWVYLSSLLTIALYFKFSRFWSVRNFDLIMLIMLAPGLVLVAHPSPTAQFSGFIWLFAVGAVFVLRMLMDSAMVRRPLLEPNLSVGGMTWLGVCLFIFLMANVANSDPNDVQVGQAADTIAEGGNDDEPAAQETATDEDGLEHEGPRYPFLRMLPVISTQTFFGNSGIPITARQKGEYSDRLVSAAKAIAIIAHMAVVLGLVFIGYRHFDNIKTGVAAAVLYMLLPYTAAMTGDASHVLPAALLVWSIATYRRPLLSGLFLGLAIAVVYYPLFLLPLWISFYWRRGLLRFVLGTTCSLGLSASLLGVFAKSLWQFFDDIQQMLGIASPKLENLQGFWMNDIGVDPVYRLPVIAVFVVLGFSFAIWPAQKNLATLMSGTAALMLGAQFWHGYGGGLCMGWYLPLLLLTVFRPNLEDRVALTVLDEGWFRGRRPGALETNKAA